MAISIEGQSHWAAPSNIALIKYWGKYGEQLPRNPSLSMALCSSETVTKLYWSKSPTPGSVTFDLKFDGEQAPDVFVKRIEEYLGRVTTFIPLLLDIDLSIETSNTFPHSAGIASSASSMASLALCLVDMERQLVSPPLSEEKFYQRASFLARLGSGSACRSIYGGYSSWGEVSNEWASPCRDISEDFQEWGDAILIVDSTSKKISSREGHSLMNGHPYAQKRFAFARDQYDRLKQSLSCGDRESFCRIVESEALQLHAMMMTSSRPYLLMRPETLIILERLRTVAEAWDFPWTYTLDAGPNIHLLYPYEKRQEVFHVIQNQLAPLCEQGRWIDDKVGRGARNLRQTEENGDGG